MQLGITGGWSSPSLAKMTAIDSTLPITLDEASWVASVVNLGRVLGAVAGGACLYCFGSKMSVLLTCLPFTLGWISTGLANSVIWLYIARSLCGIGLGMAFSCFPLYLGEISDPSIRGAIVSMSMSGMATGYVLASILSAYCTLLFSSSVYLVLCLLALTLFIYLPESPHHLVRLNNQLKAKASIAWYDRQCDIDITYKLVEKFIESSNGQNICEKFGEFKRPELRKATYIIIILFMFMQMSGLNTISFYMELILIEAKSTIIDPSLTVILVALMGIVASWMSMYLIERLGRRILLVISSIGITMALSILEIHFVLIDEGVNTNKLQALPIICMLLFQFSACAGLMTVPNTVLSEMFPPSIKCLAASMASVASAVFAFLCSKTFQPLLNVLGQKYVYWIYIAIIISAVPFALLYMPETKGKSLQQIQDDMKRKK